MMMLIEEWMDEFGSHHNIDWEVINQSKEEKGRA
jgi:hypothetical protein